MESISTLIDSVFSIIESFGVNSSEFNHYYSIIAEFVGGCGPGLAEEYYDAIERLDPDKRAFIVREHFFTALARALAGVPN